jgi:hypothetical protein
MSNIVQLNCPIPSSVNYVNHNQSLANVKLQWGHPESSNHVPEVLQQDIDFLRDKKTAMISMQLVATREIKENDEIFLNYGVRQKSQY